LAASVRASGGSGRAKPENRGKSGSAAKKIPFFKPSKELKDFVNTANGEALRCRLPRANSASIALDGVDAYCVKAAARPARTPKKSTTSEEPLADGSSLDSVRYQYMKEAASGVQPDCIFCDAVARKDDAETLLVYRGAKAFIILNRYPYTSGHVMIVPYAARCGPRIL